MDTNLKGSITEMKIMTHFLELGYNVSRPLLQSSKYDCIIDINGKLYKIQIKTARNKDNNSFVFNCKSVTTTGKQSITATYTKDEIDYFATEWKGIYYLIPVEECSVTKRLWLSTPSNPSSVEAKNYIMEEVLLRL